MKTILNLNELGLLPLPVKFVSNINYEVMMGSIAYGVSGDTSDIDIHAICTPPLEVIFPHLTGYIPGFGPAPQTFDTYQKHHIAVDEKSYDVAIYSIVKVFELARHCTPNILDLLWVPNNCVLSIDSIGRYIREHRKLFLSKTCYNKFRGYAQSQMTKLKSAPRKELVNKFGYDTKHAYHIMRLGLQCQQILDYGDMDITCNAELLKSIRGGTWTLDRFEDAVLARKNILVKSYENSTLPEEPDFNALHDMLITCINMTR